MKTELDTCNRCDGTGEIKPDVTCPKCEGSGQIDSEPSVSKPDATPSKEAKHTPESQTDEWPHNELVTLVKYEVWSKSNPERIVQQMFLHGDVNGEAAMKEVKSRIKSSLSELRFSIKSNSLFAPVELDNKVQKLRADYRRVCDSYTEKSQEVEDLRKRVKVYEIDLGMSYAKLHDTGDGTAKDIVELLEERDQLRERNEALKAEKHQATQDWSNLIAKHKTANDELRERNRVLQDFKDEINRRLDRAGIDQQPTVEHSKNDSPTLDRLDIVFDRLTEMDDIRELVPENEKLREALRGIEQSIDNQNPTHENIWRIAHAVLSSNESTPTKKDEEPI